MSNPKQPIAPPQGPALVVTGGPLNGKAVVMTGATGELLLGSGPTAHLHLEAANVETMHAKVRWNETGVFLEDMSQQLGTFLNGQRFELSCALAEGDRIWLGPPGDHNSVRVTVFLPYHPKDHPVGGAPQAAAAPEAPLQEWGALDDDEKVIATDAHPHPPARAKGTTGPIPAVASHAAAPQQRAPAPMHRRVTARPPVPRAIMVAVGAAVLGVSGFFWYSRSQAPAPVLLTLLPPKAEPGQTLQISGSGFETNAEDNVVTFADKRAEVTAASETQLSVTVPAGLPADDKHQHRVRVQARGAASNALFFRIFVGPRVAAFEPDVAMPGDVVKATGEHFGPDTAITVGGTAAEILEVQEKQLRFRVPKLSVQPGTAIAVGVQAGGNAARPATLLIGKLPLILEVVPARSSPGERVTIKGRGFDAAPGGSAVSFGGRPALVLSASERELQVVVPGGSRISGPSELELLVRALGATSTPASFQLTRPSSVVFVPRFFAEPGANPETVHVSSDLGPFLRLRGKGDAPSAAERAARAAAAFNGAMEQALKGPLSVEMREKPQAGVALAGSPQLLVAALPDDGMAYEGAHPAPRALARHWTALLQDYLALFPHKQRPMRVLELSPRGQALLEVYAAAERRAGVGAGVPPSVVENLTPAQARALAEMALSVSGDAPQSASGAAVAGRWVGTLEETGQAARPIQVRIRSVPAGLAGTLTTRSGAISGELPLQNASYSGGALRFAVKLGATPLHFDGKLDGRSVTGEVQSADGRPRGRFSLRWVE